MPGVLGYAEAGVAGDLNTGSDWDERGPGRELARLAGSNEETWYGSSMTVSTVKSLGDALSGCAGGDNVDVG